MQHNSILNTTDVERMELAEKLAQSVSMIDPAHPIEVMNVWVVQETVSRPDWYEFRVMLCCVGCHQVAIYSYLVRGETVLANGTL